MSKTRTYMKEGNVLNKINILITTLSMPTWSPVYSLIPEDLNVGAYKENEYLKSYI